MTRLGDVERSLQPEPWGQAFEPSLLDGLPDPARRLLRHAIAEGTPLARQVTLRLSGTVVQGDRRIPLTATERLVPGLGFVWRARGRMGPVWVRVDDHLLHDDSAVRVRLLGLVPIGTDAGPDIVQSARGRLAAETVWVPSMLLPAAGARWVEVDEDRARVVLDIDGHSESMLLTVDGDGRITELHMERHGDVGVSGFQRIPYGFRVLEERTFGGYTLASRLEGGWWFGTDRFDPEHASRFTLEHAEHG
jgi:hypothetical protein